jgi:lysine-specific demethylase 8
VTTDVLSPAQPRNRAPADGIDLRLRAVGLDVRPIPQVEHPTAADLWAAIANRNGPKLFCGLADDWPARRTWNPANLMRDHGGKQVTALMDLPAGGVLFPEDQQAYTRTLAFGDFLTAMLNTEPSKPCYLAYKRADELFPSADYDFTSLTGAQGTDTRVWIGSAGTRSMLHSDLKDNLFCQIWGQKNFLLVPWGQSRSAYPFPGNLVNSQIDLADVDLARFPRLRKATVYAGTILPGDILYMPRGTWHDVRSRTASVSVNHWFGSSLSSRHYLRLLLASGPRYWAATVKDFWRHGVMSRPEQTRFFFSPPSTGKRLYDLLRWGNFSRDNDPVTDER